MVKIGVIAIQGDVSEHVQSISRAMDILGIEGSVITVKKVKDVENLNGILIPGGESTTITRIMNKSGLTEKIRKMYAEESIAIMGTCAGCVILAKEVEGGEVRGLELMNMKVMRNAFGRQKESFETFVDVKGLEEPYPAVFIRAPIIEKVWDDCEVVAKLGDKIVGARQDTLLALSFHPELTEDHRIYKLFFDML